jgi:TnpA family transposase
VQYHWTDDELTVHWSLTAEELTLLPNRVDYNRLGFAVQLKFFDIEGRFPRTPREIPTSALGWIAHQLDCSPSVFQQYDWRGRARKQHRAAIRTFVGFRSFTVADASTLDTWLRQAILPSEQHTPHLQEIVLAWCREHHIEPPTPQRIERLIRSALHRHESAFFDTILQQLPPSTRARFDGLLVPVESEFPAEETSDDPAIVATVFSQLKTDPGPVGLASVLTELEKLEHLRSLDLPGDLFADVPPKILQGYRLRAATEPPREMRLHPAPIRYTLMAAFCRQRQQEVLDELVELLIRVVHRISVRAEKHVVKELLSDLQRVHGKTTLLFKLAEAALDHPHGIVNEVLYPVVGEPTLAALVKEYRAQGPAYRHHVHTLVRSSYSHHYRRMLPLILDALTFHSNNTAYQPVIDALAWLRDHHESRQQSVACADVPVDGVIRPQMQAMLIESGPDGVERIDRINYEICVLQTLRERLRCKEIWVPGAARYRNPADDVPADFTQQRAAYYHALHLPEDAETFLQGVQQAMSDALSTLDEGLPSNPKVKLRLRGKNRIHLSPLEPQPEPPQLRQLKAEVLRRWPMTSLLDMLKETDLRVGFTEAFSSLAAREILDYETRQPRLLRCLYGLGTNTGLKRMVAPHEGISYPHLLYMRRRFIQKDALREAIRRVVNATLAARAPEIWGEGTTACAADSKVFGAWDQNLMTEWHTRYHTDGVKIYWHTDVKAACIYSQLKRCNASEVAAMLEGVLRHCTAMEVDRQYVDSHGQSTVGFALCRLLGFALMPRLKAIASQKLYRPITGRPDDYPNLTPILTRPIQWELIRQQYDEMVKYATALRLGTADADTILKRFTRDNLQHPTYQALVELGKAIKTTFLCHYLHAEASRREVHEGLNVVENWNSANDFIFYGKSGEVATNQFDDQEVAVLSLHLVQACLVYINTLMLQQVLDEPGWRERMTAEDYRGLTPLIYHHVNPYGMFELDMTKRLAIDPKSAFGVLLLDRKKVFTAK